MWYSVPGPYSTQGLTGGGAFAEAQLGLGPSGEWTDHERFSSPASQGEGGMALDFGRTWWGWHWRSGNAPWWSEHGRR